MPDNMNYLIKDFNLFMSIHMCILFFPILNNLRWSSSYDQHYPNMQPPWPCLTQSYWNDAGQMFLY
ncbi:hypothetical protein VTN02DRAFT_1115 [Thermoascus thermophilus]